MRRRLAMVALLVVGVAMLSGCDVLNEIIDGIIGGGGTPGGGDPGGGTTPGAGTIVSANVLYHLDANVSERAMPTYPVDTSVEPVSVTFAPFTGTYNPTTKTFTATWDAQGGGDYADTYMEIKLNAAETAIESYYVRMTRHNVWFAWSLMHEIRGTNIPWVRDDGTTRIFSVTGASANANVTVMNYKGWTPAREGFSAASPNEWSTTDLAAAPPVQNLVASGDDVITIELEY